MKKKYFSVAVVLTAACSLMFSSCIGSFSLSNKVLSWNNQIGSKFVNEVVFFCFWIVPVYEITCLADILVVNSIEFWSGRSPVVAETKVVDGKDARYEVERDMTGYTITNLSDDSVVRFDFNQAENSWSVSANGMTTKFMEYVDDTHVRMLNQEGGFTEVELTQDGVYAYEQMVMSAQLAMAR